MLDRRLLRFDPYVSLPDVSLPDVSPPDASPPARLGENPGTGDVAVRRLAPQPSGLIRYKAKSSLARAIGLKMHSLETIVA
jgi:hypothetical protein